MAGVEEKKNIATVEEELKKAMAQIATIGIILNIKCDWESFQRLPFEQLGADKIERIQLIKLTLESLGEGFCKACEDADYKAALLDIKEIIFVPTDFKDITLKATVNGSIITIEDYSFGSTRGRDDFKNAIQKSVA